MSIVKPVNAHRPKAALQFWLNLSGGSLVDKLFEEGMVIRKLPTPLLQIVCKIILNYTF